MKIDLLAELASRRISVDDAYALYDQAMDEEVSDVRAYLGMSPREWTAHASGASFDELATWRIDGWPQLCAICQQPLDEYGWRILPGSDDASQLVHLICPNEAEA